MKSKILRLTMFGSTFKRISQVHLELWGLNQRICFAGGDLGDKNT